MHYLEKERAVPRLLLPEAETLVAVAIAYPGSRQAGETVASYARGLDYHTVLKGKLLALSQQIANDLGRPLLARPCVDTAPLLERAAAERAGIGVTGKSTLTIVPGAGTYVLLGELLLDVVLPELSQPLPKSVCGRCTRCIDECPTRAFVAPYVLDARRCISYLTIEHRGTIPREFRQAIGTHVAGCDICQIVCPFNASKKSRAYPSEFTAIAEAPDLPRLLHISSGDYRRWVKHSALSRLSRVQLMRNAAVALGNSNQPEAVPALIAALNSPHALVRAHVAWALGQKRSPEARTALQTALANEAEPDVREELEAALTESG
jgi:epoxyqueuosine reductase